MRKLGVILMTMMMVLSLVASSAQAEDPVQLRFSWWGGDERHEATLAVIDQYQELNPNVTIAGEYSGFDGYLEKLVTQIAGGTAPDIIQIDYAYLDTLWSVMDNFVDYNQQDIVDLSGFPQGMLSGVTASTGELIGLPTGQNFSINYVNSTLAAAAGIEIGQWSWDDLIANAQKLRAYDPEAYLALGDISRSIFEPYLLNQAGDNKLVNDDYSIGVTEEQLVNTFEYLGRCFAEGVLVPLEDVDTSTYGFYQDYGWLNDKVLVLPDYSSGDSAARASRNDVVAMEPFGDCDAENTGIMTRPTNMIAVNAKSANYEEALKFLQYFYYDETAIDTLKLVRSLPCVDKALARMNEEGLVPADLLSVSEFCALHKGGQGQNIISTNDLIETLEDDYISAFYYGDYTAEQAASSFIEDLRACVTDLKMAISK